MKTAGIKVCCHALEIFEARTHLANLVSVEQGLPGNPADFAECRYLIFCQQMLSFPDHRNVFTEVAMLVKADAIYRTPGSAKWADN